MDATQGGGSGSRSRHAQSASHIRRNGANYTVCTEARSVFARADACACVVRACTYVQHMQDNSKTHTHARAFFFWLLQQQPQRMRPSRARCALSDMCVAHGAQLHFRVLFSLATATEHRRPSARSVACACVCSIAQRRDRFMRASSGGGGAGICSLVS